MKDYDPRNVFLTEAGHFTPWLADNIHLINQIVGYNIKVLDTEYLLKPTNRRIDILGITADKKNFVVIENQLETADLDHYARIQLYISLINDQIDTDIFPFVKANTKKILVILWNKGDAPL